MLPGMINWPCASIRSAPGYFLSSARADPTSTIFPPSTATAPFSIRSRSGSQVMTVPLAIRSGLLMYLLSDNRGSTLHRQRQAFQIARIVGHPLDPIFGDPHRIRMPETAHPRHVQSRLDGEDHAWL